MATEKQKLASRIYNQRWRAKQSKIKSLSKQLDAAVQEMEKLPLEERKEIHERAELLCAQLEQLEPTR